MNIYGYIKTASLKEKDKKDKYLVVGESHYLSPEDTEKIGSENSEKFAKEWNEGLKEYRKSKSYVTSFEKKICNKEYFDTEKLYKEIFEYYKGEEKIKVNGLRSKKVMWIVGRGMVAAGNESKKSSSMDAEMKKEIASKMENYDFMNYYQRPELIKGNSMSEYECDNSIAYENFKQEILKGYKGCIVLSKKVANNIIRHDECSKCEKNKGYFKIENVPIIFLTHPAYVCDWGYQRDENSYAKLIDFLKKLGN